MSAIRFSILAAMLICLALPLSAAQFTWGIYSASQDSITAWVTATPDGPGESLYIDYDNWFWVKLFVDGEWDQNAPEPGSGTSWWITMLNPYTCYISYNPAEPIAYGVHEADVRRYDDPWVYLPFLDTLEVRIVPTFTQVTFSSQIVSATPSLINISVTMLNSTATDCIINFPDNQWLKLFLDGTQVIPNYQNNPSWLVIPPGNNFIATLMYLPNPHLAYGDHQVQVQVTDFGFLPQLPFTLFDPSTAEDDLVPPQTNLKVYPNPFRSSTRIEMSQAEPSTSLTVCDLRGRLVKKLVPEQMGSPNSAVFLWDGKDDRGALLPNGVYLLTGNTPQGRIKQKVSLVR